jgi:hypothetical protein
VKYGVRPLNGLDDMMVVVWEGWAGCRCLSRLKCV